MAKSTTGKAIGKGTSVEATAKSLPTSEDALAFVQKLGLTAEDLATILAAKPVTPAELTEGDRANVVALAGAFTEGELEAIAAGNPFAVKEVKPAAVVTSAHKIQAAASALAKLRDAADLVEGSVHGDVQTLVKAERDLFPQVEARAKVDTEIATTWSALLAYHHTRFPGGKGKKKKPPTDPSGT